MRSHGNEVVVVMFKASFDLCHKIFLKFQPRITRMHPAMGIPCLLSDVNNIDIGLNVCAENNILRFMNAVSCEKPFFKLKFLRKRIDGVMAVELVDSNGKP